MKLSHDSELSPLGSSAGHSAESGGGDGGKDDECTNADADNAAYGDVSADSSPLSSA